MDSNIQNLMRDLFNDAKVMIGNIGDWLDLATRPEQVDTHLAEIRSQARDHMKTAREDADKYANIRNDVAFAFVLAAIGAASIFTSLPGLIGAAIAVIGSVHSLRMHVVYSLKLMESKTLERFWAGFTVLRLAPEDSWGWMPTSGIKKERMAELMGIYTATILFAVYQCVAVGTELGWIEACLVLIFAVLYILHFRKEWQERMQNHKQMCLEIMKAMNSNIHPKFRAMFKAAYAKCGKNIEE